MLKEGLTYLKAILPEQKILTFAFSVVLSALLITTPSPEHNSIIESISKIKINEILLYRDGAIGSLTIGDILIASLITILSKLITNEIIVITYKTTIELLKSDLESRFYEWKEELKESHISIKTAKELRNKNIEKLQSMKELISIPNTIALSFIFLIYTASKIDLVVIVALISTSIYYSSKLSIYFLERVFTYESIIRFRKNKEPKIPERITE